MHVGAGRVAFAGLLVAFSSILLILSSVIESNSLILIGSAAFCVGIAVREWGLKFGLGFLIASTFVGFIVAPNKFYCITFTAMGFYIWASEVLWEKIACKDGIRHREARLWIGKYLIFNAVYIPAIVIFPELLFVKPIKKVWIFLVFLLGQIGLFVYDKVYIYFQGMIWGKLRIRLINKH